MSQNMKIPGLMANGDISTSQFYAVRMTTNADFEIGAISAVTQRPIGVLQNNPNSSGLAADVLSAGETKMQFAGTINRGVSISADALGRAIESTISGGTTGLFVLGQTLQSGSSGGVYRVLIHDAWVVSSTV